MKKFIYTVSFLAIVLTFTGTSVLAQSVTRVDANIPFDFAIGEETFAAGKYVMRLRKTNSGVQQVELRDANHKVVYEAFMVQNGDLATGRPEMVFDQIGGRAVLAKIRLKNIGIEAPVEKDASLTLASKERKRANGSSN